MRSRRCSAGVLAIPVALLGAMVALLAVIAPLAPTAAQTLPPTETWAPLCAELAARVTIGPDGLPPLPKGAPPPGTADPSIGVGLPVLGGGYNPWIQQSFLTAAPSNVDTVRAALTAHADRVCVEVQQELPIVSAQPLRGPGWRLLAAGPFKARSLIGVAATNKQAAQLWTNFGVPGALRKRLTSNEVMVGYSLHVRGGCQADHIVGVQINRNLRTFQLQRARPVPTDECPLNREPWAVVLAVKRSALPGGRLVFKDCPLSNNCSWSYLVVDVVDLASKDTFVRVSDPGRPTSRGQQVFGTCGQAAPIVKLPVVRLCEVVDSFDETRVVGSARFDNGTIAFFLLSPSEAPIELPGIVVAVGYRSVAMLHGFSLKVRRGDATTSVLTFTNGLPRANSSGREGAFSPDGRRLAVFLQAPGSSRDSDSVAVGIVHSITGP